MTEYAPLGIATYCDGKDCKGSISKYSSEAFLNGSSHEDAVRNFGWKIVGKNKILCPACQIEIEKKGESNK